MSETFVLVKNNSKADFSARYDGELHTIAAGEGATMAADAAQHLFGYGLEGTKEEIRKGLIDIGLRHGWHVGGTGKNEVAEAAILKRFKDFAISQCRLTAETGQAKTAGE